MKKTQIIVLDQALTPKEAWQVYTELSDIFSMTEVPNSITKKAETKSSELKHEQLKYAIPENQPLQIDDIECR